MKKIVIALLGVFIITLSGCNTQKLESIGVCPVEMVTATQKDRNIDTTYTMLIPKDWQIVYASSHNVKAAPSYVKSSSEIEEDPSIMIQVVNYSDNKSDEQIQKYTDLFKGNTQKYEESELMESKEFGGNATNFEYKIYRGEYGKVAEVRYTATLESYPDKTWYMIYCFREDIPYFAVGVFDSSKELSSGEVIPWVIDSLQVEGLV